MLDLRHRRGTASGGLFPRNGAAGNLPSGETYIVPYEGEIEDDPSRSSGTLPVQFEDEVVVYRIVDNRAVEVLSQGRRSDEERRAVTDEPAYANLAELGLGVLDDFGLEPTGSILLDEKLGLHIAFGRSDHFGGQVAPADFSAPDKVVHIDRVYIEAIQPRVQVVSVTLDSPSGEREIMRDGRYCGVW
jgi:leucyl aminopeptidase (aminopeptidase T)